MKKEHTHGYIYVLTCLVTMREYVGQAVCWKTRWKQHCGAAKAGSACAIHRAIKKYPGQFALTIVRRCSIGDLNRWEEYYIDKFDTLMPNGYNMTEGGDGVRGQRFSKKTLALRSMQMLAYYQSEAGRARILRTTELTHARHADPKEHARLKSSVGWKHAKAARRKIAEAAKAQWDDPSRRAVIVASLQNRKPLSTAVRARIANALIGKVHSAETKAKMAKTQQTRYADPAARERHSAGIRAWWKIRKENLQRCDSSAGK